MSAVGRGSSPLLIGRSVELERVRVAVRSAREADRCVVLVSGEAGIGKSRLLLELARSVAADPPSPRPVSILRGSCIDVGGRLAYLPVIELLEGARQFGADIAAEVAAIRESLGGGTGASEDAEPPARRAATFLRIREVLAAAASEHQVVAVIDDLHWADRSTLDVVSFLAGRLVGTGVLLLLSYRSDELNRRHPLRPVLADIERHATFDHIRLGPLTSREVRAQVAGILGREPDAGRLDRVVRLADGNPFHVEELMSLDDDHRLPPTLRQVLDARLDRLDDRSRRVVEVAAVIGRHVNAALLTAVVGSPEDDVDAGLRDAVDERIVVSVDVSQQYAFRHALLRESVYEGIPPSARIATHRRIARMLTDHPELGDISPTVALADRARHWLAARADAEAFTALLEAARSAASAAAWAEACAAFEDAIALWDRVRDPVSLAGTTRSNILEQAAEIAWLEGDTRRALALNRRAQVEPDIVAEPLRLGRLAYREAWLLDDLGDLAGESDAADRASRLVPLTPPSRDRAAVLSRAGLVAVRQGRVRDAIELFDQAIATAEAIRVENEVAANLAFLGMALVDQGEIERPAAVVLRLDAILPRIDEQVAWSVVTTWAPWIWMGMGEYPRAIEYADRLLADARRRGLDRGVGLWSLAPRALAEFWLGRWDEASVTIERQGEYAWGIDAAVYLRSVGAMIAAGREDAVRGRALAEEVIEIARAGFPEQTMVARAAAAWVELMDSRPDRALEHVRAAWALASQWEGLVVRSLLLWLGSWAAADAADRSRSGNDVRGPKTAIEFGADLAAAVAAATRGNDMDAPAASGPRLVLALAAAEAARVERRDTAGLWTALADRFEQLGDLPRAALTRQREAATILRDRGDRVHATMSIRASLDHADAIGAPRLRRQALAVAQAGRLKLEPTPRQSPRGQSAAATWGLSTREREVLALLVGGRTNRQIAEALFISHKTASVHITHILDKLGVSRRTDAAIAAIRAGIIGDAGTVESTSPLSRARG